MYHSRMSDKKHDLVFDLLAAASRIERRLDASLSNVKGISFSEYFLLKQLAARHDGAATRVDLANSVRLTPSAVTRALKPLEKLGFVTTRKGVRDARQSIAKLTKAGEGLLSDSDSLVRDEISALPLPRSVPAEFAGFVSAIAES